MSNFKAGDTVVFYFHSYDEGGNNVEHEFTDSVIMKDGQPCLNTYSKIPLKRLIDEEYIFDVHIHEELSEEQLEQVEEVFKELFKDKE